VRWPTAAVTLDCVTTADIEGATDRAVRAMASGSLFDLQVGEDLRLDGELVGKVVALGLPSFVVLRASEIPTHL
jgi:hypothetical protein